MRWHRPLLAYLAAAVVTTWPLVLHPASLLGAPSGPGDPFLNLWILGWNLQALTANPFSVVNGHVFDANIFHPAQGTLAYSDHLLLQSALLVPVYAVTHNVVVCYNVLLIGSLLASALAMHAFVRSVVGSEGGAYLAGLAWGFGSYRFAHLIHLQLQSLYVLPLAFLCLHRVMAGRQSRDVVALGGLAGVQALASVYYGIIGGLALAVAGIALAVSSGRGRSVAVLRRFAAAGAIAVLVVAPVAFVYWKVAQREGFGRNLYEAGRNAAFVSSYVQAPPGNVLYGRTGVLRLRDVAGTRDPPRTGPERELFPGFVLIALAVAGVWLGRRSDSRPTVAAMVAISVLGFLLSLGPDGVRPLYTVFYQSIFGFAVIRAPARFSVVVVFSLCALAAIGWRELSSHAHGVRRVTVPQTALALLMVCAMAEWLHIPPAFAAAPPLRTDVGQWLAREPGAGAVALLPLDTDIASTPAMVQSLEHRRPIVNGYSGQRPSFYGPLVDALNTFPSDDALLALHESGVRFVVTPAPVGGGERSSPVIERARLEGGTIYELRWTAEAEARLAAASRVEPPPVGPIPFRIGEVARYSVSWGGAGMNLSAGDITVSVEPPAYRLVVKAVTAPWVAKFFEAQDVFATQANTMLLPEIHERDQQEGSRHAVRAFIYDHAARVVRTGRSVEDARTPGAVALPMLPNARDTLAALFYARTLPLRVGEHYRFPVNEAGRNLVVDLGVDRHESIPILGQEVEALRVTPQLQRFSEAGRAGSATVWMSSDPGHLPLAIEVDAAFGHVRLELEHYEIGAQ